MPRGECPASIAPYRFKPGQSGNPAGKPKKKTFEAMVREILEKQHPSRDCSNQEFIAARFVDLLMNGDRRMLVQLLEREWPRTLRHEIEFPESGRARLEAALDRFVAGDAEPFSSESDGDRSA